MYSKIQYISQGITAQQHLSHIRSALDQGVDWVQLRLKNSTADEICNIGQQVALLCQSYKACFILNDHTEWVKEVGADGVHLGQKDRGIREARSILGSQAIIGGTANTLADVYEHIHTGCDYIGLGPFRYTRTKTNLSPILGLAGYQEIFRQLSIEKNTGNSVKPCPIYAIGGIEPNDIFGLLDAGVYGIALSGYLTVPDNHFRSDEMTAGKTAIQQSDLRERIYQLKKLLYV